MHIVQQASYGHDDVQITSREPLFQGFVQVERVYLKHRLFNQEGYTPVISRELVQRQQAAGILLYDDQQQKFALIEQFRVGALQDSESPWQLEIIAGVLDADESAESCVRRESIEESGCEVDQLTHIFSFYPSAGACNEMFHLYAAEMTLPSEGGIFGLADENENIKLHLIEYSELDALLTGRRLRNAPVIMALQWLKQHLST